MSLIKKYIIIACFATQPVFPGVGPGMFDGLVSSVCFLGAAASTAFGTVAALSAKKLWNSAPWLAKTNAAVAGVYACIAAPCCYYLISEFIAKRAQRYRILPACAAKRQNKVNGRRSTTAHASRYYSLR